MLSKKHKIDLFESSKKILNGASRSNQFRFHYGFHYPKSIKTVKEIKNSNIDFIKFFGNTLFGNTKNNYLVAKNSEINLHKYVSFLKKNKLNFKIIPNNNRFIEEAILTKEKILNYFKFEKLVKQKLINVNINLKLSSDFKKKDLKDYDKVIIFSYANNNYVLKKLGIEKIKKLKYELVEKIIVKLPKEYRKKSDVVIYGKFVCIDPYLGTNYHLLSDVKLSKLEVIKSKYPNFKNKNQIYLNKGIIKNKKLSKFDKVISRSKKYLPYLEFAKYIGSYFVVRVIQVNSVKNDQRTTEITKHNKKIISVISGKWNNCVSLSKKIESLLEK